MNILILGGTKFFGKKLALDMAKKGHNVTVFSRACPVKDLPKQINQIKGLRGDLSALQNTKWDAVFDNICYNAAQMREAVKTFTGNTKHYILMSSGDVHLAVKGAKSPFSETLAHKLPPLKKADAYGQGKYEAETTLIKSDLPYTIVRLPIIVGPGDPKDRLAVYLRDILNGAPVILPDGSKYKRRFIYVDDAARALTLVIQNRARVKGKTLHFGGEVITLKQFVKLCYKFCGKKENTINMPYAKLKKLKYDAAARNPYFNPFDYVLKLTNANKLLNWKPTPIQKWLKDTILTHNKQFSA
ncbi:nucleoside-diphosphate-sugar epimerase [Elusimicrobium simillimum]|uniref:NAD-dependent epimerase/dehydratase family protein n=1 Tax=Elusimicrobium simillimum TaxID=3143438 RepID=UPI003C6FC83C